MFIFSYMVLVFVFGYLGDRYNWKYFMCGGIVFWFLVILGLFFIFGEYFWLFFLIWGLVGVGEVSYFIIVFIFIVDFFVVD